MQAEISFGKYVLRQPVKQDALQLFKLVETNKPRLQDYFPLAINSITSPEATESYITSKISQAQKKEAFTYLLIDTTNQALVGVMFIKNFDWAIPKAELAYYIDKAYEGKGIITEALKHIIHYCFTTLQLNKVYLRTATDNIGSQKVALKNGFKLEGVLRNEYRIFDRSLIDLNYYGLIKA